jgi:YfiH family protein
MAQPLTKDSGPSGVITIAEFEAGHPVRHFFGTRNRSGDLRSPFSYAPSFGRAGLCDPRSVVSVKQVHGTDALVVDRPIEAGTTFPGGWDAVITNQSGVLVTVRTADCVPILLHDPIQRVVAAVHSGWRGSVAGIVPQTLMKMQHEFGSQAGSVQVAIGPSAGPCCYEVDEPVLKPLRSFPFWKLVVQETGPGRALLDLREFIRHQTHAAGVSEQNIWTVSHCTICRPDLFFSYRREGVVKETMTSGIMLSEAHR